MSWTDACQSNYKVTKLYDSSFANITCEKVKDYKVIDYSRSEDAVYKLINFKFSSSQELAKLELYDILMNIHLLVFCGV